MVGYSSFLGTLTPKHIHLLAADFFQLHLEERWGIYRVGQKPDCFSKGVNKWSKILNCCWTPTKLLSGLHALELPMDRYPWLRCICLMLFVMCSAQHCRFRSPVTSFFFVACFVFDV